MLVYKSRLFCSALAISDLVSNSSKKWARQVCLSFAMQIGAATVKLCKRPSRPQSLLIFDHLAKFNLGLIAFAVGLLVRAFLMRVNNIYSGSKSAARE